MFAQSSAKNLDWFPMDLLWQSLFLETSGIGLVLGSCSIVPLIFSMDFNETAALDDIFYLRAMVLK